MSSPSKELTSRIQAPETDPEASKYLGTWTLCLLFPSWDYGNILYKDYIGSILPLFPAKSQ